MLPSRGNSVCVVGLMLGTEMVSFSHSLYTVGILEDYTPKLES